MDISNYKIDPSIFRMFGGKAKRKRSKQRKKRSKQHTNYSQIKLKKIDIEHQEPINDTFVYDIESVLILDDSINFTKSIELKDNKSRESENDENYDNHTPSYKSYNNSFNSYSNCSSPRPVHTHIFNVNTNDFVENENSQNTQDEIDNDDQQIIDLLGNSNCNELSYSESMDHDDMNNNNNNLTNKFINFDVNDIGHIGAIRTNDYIENKFRESRRQSIQSDLFDLMFSDTDCDLQEDNKNDNRTIDELLTKFELHSFDHYFSEILCIQFVAQIINYLPNTIKQSLMPFMCSHMKRMMQFNKMIKYLSIGVINGDWNGSQSKQWMDIQNNCIYNIFQYQSNFLINHKMMKTLNRKCAKMNAKYKHYDVINLNGFQRKYVTNLNIDFAEIKIIIKQLPDAYKFESALFKIGIETSKHESMYICDRLSIRKNDKYLSSIFYGEFIENESCVYIKISKRSKRRLNINICHITNGDFQTFHHKSYSKNFKLKINKKSNTAKVFIEQFNGFGEYAVLY